MSVRKGALWVESHTYRCTCRRHRWLKKGRVKSQCLRTRNGKREGGELTASRAVVQRRPVISTLDDGSHPVGL